MLFYSYSSYSSVRGTQSLDVFCLKKDYQEKAKFVFLKKLYSSYSYLLDHI